MKRLLFATFADPLEASSAWEQLRVGAPPAQTVRLHRGELDVLLAADLAGTPAQRARENRVASRFALIFLALCATGFFVDVVAGWHTTGLPVTVALSTVGVALGTIVVLRSRRAPLDDALVAAGDALNRGESIVTVPIDDAERDRAAETIAQHGGETFFEA